MVLVIRYVVALRCYNKDFLGYSNTATLNFMEYKLCILKG